VVNWVKVMLTIAYKLLAQQNRATEAEDRADEEVNE
jgi:hypothetical protein